MAGFISILVATFLDSITGLIGVFSLYVREETLEKIVKTLVAFAAGAMIAGALVHMLPKALTVLHFEHTGETAILGFATFFLLERYIHWHHCHETKACDVHPVTKLTIIGDAIHNFIDGIVIAAAFLADSVTGWITTALIIGHEVPQELGNFSVLLYGGYEKKKAILWTFLSQATCILGSILGWFFTPQNIIAPILAFAAGGFLYIGASDLVPELHREKDVRKSVWHFVWFLVGVAFMIGIKVAVHH